MNSDIVAVSTMMRWRADANAFVEEVFGVTPDPWQREALKVISQPKPLVRFAAVSAKGTGKSCFMALAGLWWFFTRVGAQVICTSITGKNLKDGLFKELAYWWGKSELLRSVSDFMSDRVVMKEDPRYWFISARSWAQDADAAAQASTLAGLHGSAMAYLADEVGDYPLGVLPAADAMAANIGPENECRIIACGNPTDVNGPLYQITTAHRAKWEVRHITADPDDPLRTNRVSKEWAQDQIQLYGRDHPFCAVNILGQFPKTALNTLLSPDEVRTSSLRKITELDYHWAQKRLGVDVARFGDDKTVVSFRQGVKLGPFVEMQGADNQQVAARVALAMRRTGAEVVFVDADGVGAGVVDALKTAGINYHAVHSAGKPFDPRYYNRRAEMWYGMAEWVKDRGRVPGDKSELIKDLTTPRYTMHKGKILIEEKSEIKKRLGNSPDYGDSVALTFSIPDSPTLSPEMSMAMMIGENRKDRKGDYDPVGEAGSAGDFDPFRGA